MPRDWLVEDRCPQCGGPVSMLETDRILTCAYCRVRLYVLNDGVPRFCLPVKPAPVGEIVMAPYWRVRAAVFRPSASGLSGRVIDRTALACGAPRLPSSLGVRAQAVPLRFASPSEEGRFLPVGSPPPGSGPAFQHFARLGPGEDGEDAVPDVHLAGIQDLTPWAVASLVYAPVRVARSVFDAVLNRRMAGIDGDAWKKAAGEGDDRPQAVRFLATLCPECGWQLEGGSNTLVLVCPNCSRAWRAGGNALQETRYALLPSSGWSPDAYLPFWRVAAGLEGIVPHGLKEASWADLVRFTKLPRVVQPGWDRESISLWFPAFQAGPEQFLRLALTLTLARPTPEAGAAPSSARLCRPLTAPERGLADAAKLLLAALTHPRPEFLTVLEAAPPAVREAQLVYVPVLVNNREQVNPELGLAVHGV